MEKTLYLYFGLLLISIAPFLLRRHSRDKLQKKKKKENIIQNVKKKKRLEIRQTLFDFFSKKKKKTKLYANNHIILFA